MSSDGALTLYERHALGLGSFSKSSLIEGGETAGFGARSVPKAPSNNSGARTTGGLSGPIPSGGQETGIPRVQGGSGDANHPRSVFSPQRDPPRFGRGELANHISRGRCDMGRPGAAGAVTHFGKFGDICLFPRLVGPRARSHLPRQDVLPTYASAEQKFSRRVRHD